MKNKDTKRSRVCHLETTVEHHNKPLDHHIEHAMKSGLSRSGLRDSKKEEGSARETDPLLSRRAAESHHHGGSIRSRRNSRSPASLMNPDDRYTANVASGTIISEEVYSEDVYELHTDSTSTESERQQQAQHTGLQPENRTAQPVSGDQVFHLRRTNAVYRPGDRNAAQRPLDDNGEPPLLEIPEEIYSVRKSALQVMKPLIGSWVRALKPLYYLLNYLE